MSTGQRTQSLGTGKVEDLVVIVRSANERTEQLCLQLVKQQVPELRVVVIHERPFSAAVRRAFEIGLDFGLDWTLCVDADVLLPKGAISSMIAHLGKKPEASFGGTGYILDRFYGGRNRGGPHLYRTCLLERALPLVPDASVSLRPETYVHSAMSTAGYEWVTVDQLLGIHDFEQFYHDIYRKMIVRAKKSPRNALRLLDRAILNSRIDMDFLVAAWGLRVGMSRSEDLTLDSRQWSTEAEALLLANDIRDKCPLALEDGLGLIDELFDECFVTYDSHNSNRVPGANGSRPLGHIMPPRFNQTVAWQTGRLLARAGSRLQRWASR